MLIFFGARRGGFQCERVHQNIADAREHFLLLVYLFAQRFPVLPHRDSQQEQAGLLRIRDDVRRRRGVGALERQGSLAGAAEEHAGHQQAVDLIGAFEDAIDARIAIGPLHGIVLMIAVAAMDLHGFVHHVIQRLRAEDLDQGALDGELFTGLHQGFSRILNVAGHAIRHAFIHVHPDRHFGQLVLDQAELGDGFSESPALAGVADRIGQRLAAFAVRGDRQRQPPDVQDVEREDVAAPDLAQDVLHRDVHVIEIDGGGGTALQSHLLFFRPGRNTGPGAFHQKRRELFAAHFGEYRIQIRDAAIGDPHLLAVEHVVRSIGCEIRPRAHGQGIGSGLRLGQTVGGDQLGRREPGKILLLLLFGAEQQHRQHADTGLAAVADGVGAIAANAFGHDHRGNQIELHAAVTLRQQYAHQPQLGRLPQGALQNAEILVLDRFQIGFHFARPEVFGGFGDSAVLGREVLGRKHVRRSFQQERASI